MFYIENEGKLTPILGALETLRYDILIELLHKSSFFCISQNIGSIRIYHARKTSQKLVTQPDQIDLPNIKFHLRPWGRKFNNL